MAKDPRTLGKKVSRRSFLKAVGAAGVGLAGLSALPGCAPQATPAPAATPTPHVSELNFAWWSGGDEFTEHVVERFTEHYPNIKVHSEATPWAAYTEKLLSGFTVGPTPDVLRVHVAGPLLVDAGYLRPIDDLPGVDELKADMLEGAFSSVTWPDGKMYGLLYFLGGILLSYNEEILETAGISEPPKSLDELKEQCLIIKDKGILDMPLMMPEYIPANGRAYYSLLYASGGRLFDDEANPIPLSENRMAVEVMEWCAKAHLDWGITDPAGITLGWEDVAKVFNDGKLAFQLNQDYNLARANDPELSQVAGKSLFVPTPGLGPESQGSQGQGWFYGMAAATKEVDATWELMKFLGGKDWNGEYYCAKWFLQKFGVLFPYKSMFDDPEVVELLQRYRDLDLLGKAMAGYKPLETFFEPWYTEWADFFAAAYHDAVTGVKTPEEALQASLDKAAQLKTA